MQCPATCLRSGGNPGSYNALYLEFCKIPNPWCFFFCFICKANLSAFYCVIIKSNCSTCWLRGFPPLDSIPSFTAYVCTFYIHSSISYKTKSSMYFQKQLRTIVEMLLFTLMEVISLLTLQVQAKANSSCLYYIRACACSDMFG